MEQVGELFYDELDLAAKEPERTDRAVLARRALHVASGLSMAGKGLAPDGAGGDFLAWAGEAESFFRRLAELGREGSGSLEELLAGRKRLEAATCNRCHDKYAL